MIEVGSFGPEAVSFLGSGDDHLVDGIFFHGRTVRLKFRHAKIPVSVDKVQVAVIEKKRSVMEEAVQNCLLPRAAHDVAGLEDISLVLVVRHEKGVIHPVMVTERSCPLALPVGVATVPKVVDVIILQRIEYIRNDPPVDKVLRMHDRRPRAEEHRGTYHIIVIPNPNHIVVRNVGIRERIHGNLGLLFCGATGQNENEAHQKS